MKTMTTATRVAYGINEGFESLGLTRTAGYKAIANGELRTYKIGRRRFVTQKELERFSDFKQRQSAGAA